MRFFGIQSVQYHTTKPIIMNKHFLFATALLLIGYISQAQSFHFGPKLGANIGKIEGKDFSQEYTLGYHLGGFAEIGLSKKWKLQGEVLWNQINADTATGFSATYQNIRYQEFSNPRLDYISFPVLLGYNFSKRLTLQAGPQFGILVDQNRNILNNGKDAFKKGDLSLLMGAQINVMKLRIYGRYAIGLNEINDIDTKNKWRSQGFQLGVGLAL
jgi:opacity protein-like surface antigen